MTSYIEAAARVSDFLKRYRDNGNVDAVLGTDTLLQCGWASDESPGVLTVADLQAILGQHREQVNQRQPLVDQLRAAAARVADYAGPEPLHWAIGHEDPYDGPLLLADTGQDQVSNLGMLDPDLSDRELDLIGLFSPQTAADLSALLDRLADQIAAMSVIDLIECRWMPEAHALTCALNRQHDWATHPRGVRAPQADEPVPFDAGDGPIPGYYAGRCGHRVAISEWNAGFRVCERCPREVVQ